MQENKLKLQKAIAEIVKKYRGNKSISKLSNEIDLSKSVWAELERGKKDIQLSTLWRIAEALKIKVSTVILEIENMLGEDFSFIE